METTTTLKAVLGDSKLYFGDNGRVFCGAHAGASAKFTGRDISGQRVKALTARDHAEARSAGVAFECESCKWRKVRP